MSNLVELIFQANGTKEVAAASEQVAAAIDKINAATRAAAAADQSANVVTEKRSATVAEWTARLRELRVELHAATEAGDTKAIANIKAEIGSIEPALIAVARARKQAADQAKEHAEREAQASAAVRETVQGLVGFISASAAAAAVYGVLKESLGEGQHFKHLHDRTGESIRDLVMLEQAFRNVGLGESQMTTAEAMLDRILGATGDEGKKADVALQRLGTSIAELKPLQFAEQLEVLNRGFSNLANTSDRVAVARTLFGRGGTSILQLLGDPEAMTLARRQTEDLGAAIERNADASVKLQEGWNGVLAEFRTLGQEAATQLLPTLQSIVDLLGHLPTGPLGAGLTATGGLVGAELLGGAGLALGIGNLETGLTKAATKFTGTMAGEMAGLGAEFAGAMTTFLAPALAAAIAIQITEGVMLALNNAEMQKIFNEARETRETREKFTGANVGTTEVAAQDALVGANRKLQELEERRAALEGGSHTEYIAVGGQLQAVNAAGPSEEAKEQIAAIGREIVNLSKVVADLNDPVKRAATIAANQARIYNLAADKDIQRMPQLQEKDFNQSLKSMSPVDALDVVQARRMGLEAQLAKPAPQGADPKAVEATQLALQEKIDEMKAKELALQKQIDDEDFKHQLIVKETAAQAAENSGDKAGAEKIRREIVAERELHGLKGQELDDVKALQAARDAADQREREFQHNVMVLQTQQQEALARGDKAAADKFRREAEAMREQHALSGQALADIKALEAARDAADATALARENARKAIEAERTALENTLNILRERIATIEGDFARTAADKWEEKRAELLQEIAVLKKQIKADQDAAADAYGDGNDAAGAEFAQSAAAKGHTLAGTQGQLAGMGANPLSFVDQLRSKITSARNEMGTWQQTLATGFSEAFSNASTGLQKLMGDTEYWSSKLGNIAGPIMGSITKAIANMFTEWIAKRIMASIASKTASVEEGATDTAAKAPGAILSSISSFGVAAAVGVAAVIAAMALAGGFATGGFPSGTFQSRPQGFLAGPGTGTSDEIFAKVSNREWIAPEWMTDHPVYGPMIGSLEAARVGTPGFKGGGLFGGWFGDFASTLWFNPFHPDRIARNQWNYYAHLPLHGKVNDWLVKNTDAGKYFPGLAGNAPGSSPSVTASAPPVDVAATPTESGGLWSGGGGASSGASGDGGLSAGMGNGSIKPANVNLFMDPKAFALVVEQELGSYHENITERVLRRLGYT